MSSMGFFSTQGLPDFIAYAIELDDGERGWQRGEGLTVELLLPRLGGARWVPATQCAANRTWQVVDATETQWSLLWRWLDASRGLWESSRSYFESKARNDAPETIALPKTVYGGHWR